MSSNRTSTRTVRITNESQEFFREKPLNRYIEWLYEMISEGKIEEKDGNLSVHTSNVEMSEEVYAEIKSMADYFQMSLDEFFLEVCNSMNEGLVVYEGGKFKGEEEFDFADLREACYMKGVTLSQAFERLTKMIREGK